MFIMTTITINVDDDTARRFRETVASKYGVGKGTLGKAVGEALEKWSEEKNITDMRERALKILEKGFDLKGAASRFDRKDIYGEITKHRTGH